MKRKSYQRLTISTAGQKAFNLLLRDNNTEEYLVSDAPALPGGLSLDKSHTTSERDLVHLMPLSGR